MQTPVYILSIVASVAGLWFLWAAGLKPLFLDMYREQLFAVRFRLFRLGISGELALDSDAYRAMEALLCGLLRFGHRVTFLTYIFSSIEQSRAKKEDKDYVDVPQQIGLKISRLNPDTQKKLASILNDARSAVIMYVAFTSLFFLAIAAVLKTAYLLGIWRPTKAKLSHPVEQEVYRAEMARRPLRPATV